MQKNLIFPQQFWHILLPQSHPNSFFTMLDVSWDRLRSWRTDALSLYLFHTSPFSFPLNCSWFLTHSFTTPTIIIYLSPSLSESLTFSLTIQSHLHFVCFSLVTTSFPLYCSWFPTYSVTTTYKRTNLVLFL